MTKIKSIISEFMVKIRMVFSCFDIIAVKI